MDSSQESQSSKCFEFFFSSVVFVSGLNFLLSPLDLLLLLLIFRQSEAEGVFFQQLLRAPQSQLELISVILSDASFGRPGSIIIASTASAYLEPGLGASSEEHIDSSLNYVKVNFTHLPVLKQLLFFRDVCTSDSKYC